MAQDAHHSGDGWFPGEKAGRRERQVHPSAHARPPGSTRCTPILNGLVLNSGEFNRFFTRCPFQPPQYKLDPRLARLLGVHTQTRASIMQALWLYIKNNKLQDSHEKEYINCNRYFRQVTLPFKPRRQAGFHEMKCEEYALLLIMVGLTLEMNQIKYQIKKNSAAPIGRNI